jgi:hypothetical protein
MRFVLAIVFLFTNYSSFSQQPPGLPYEHIVKHLLTAGDMPPQQRWEDGYQKLVIMQLFGNDTSRLYLFCSSTRPHYNHILLKRSGSFRILNCENLTKEFEIIDEYIGPAKDSFTYDHLAVLASWYKANLSRDSAALRRLPATSNFNFGKK